MYTPEGKIKEAFPKENFDNNVKPQNDFYRFVNGGWMKSNSIPDKYSMYGVSQEIHEKARQILEAYGYFIEVSSDFDNHST